MKNQLDHILWAVPRFDAGVELMERMTGVLPSYGGVHPELGTRNAILALGDKCYLEVIGPDPDRSPHAGFGTLLEALEAPQVFTAAVRVSGMSAIAAALHELGVPADGPTPMTRLTADGSVLRWEILVPKDEELGWQLPFFIDWGDSPHPADAAPKGCKLNSIELLHPNAQRLAKVASSLQIDIPVGFATKAGFQVEIDTPKGRVLLAAGAWGGGSSKVRE